MLIVILPCLSKTSTHTHMIAKQLRIHNTAYNKSKLRVAMLRDYM